VLDDSMQLVGVPPWVAPSGSHDSRFYFAVFDPALAAPGSVQGQVSDSQYNFDRDMLHAAKV